MKLLCQAGERQTLVGEEAGWFSEGFLSTVHKAGGGHL